MIGVDLKGRLGNQMFRYAFARAIMIRRKNIGIDDELIISNSDFRNLDAENGWENSLSYFNVHKFTSVSEKLVYRNNKLVVKLLLKIYYLIGKLSNCLGRNFQLCLQKPLTYLLSKCGYAISLDNDFDFSNIIHHKNIYIDGSFENIKYFDSVRDILIKEFTPKGKRLEHNLDLYNLIESTNSVCISIRRGDYISNKSFKDIYNVCTEDYFLKAIDVAKKRIDNPTFIVFSDDIEWARAWFKQNLADESVFFEKGTDPVWEKLRLMYLCKHFIISNSSFSWWVSYLGNFSNKLIISPSRWYNDNRPAYLILDSFIKVDI